MKKLLILCGLLLVGTSAFAYNYYTYSSMNLANPANPISPLNPANPASPVWVGRSHSSSRMTVNCPSDECTPMKKATKYTLYKYARCIEYGGGTKACKARYDLCE